MHKMKHHITIFLSAFILSTTACNLKEMQSAETSSVSTEESSNISISNIQDTVFTKDGGFFQLIFETTDSYKIRWGDKTKFNTSDKTFELISSGLLLAASSKDAILLTQSCGTSCTHGVVLTINPKMEIKEYFLLKAHDLNESLVAYTPSESNALIKIENFLTENFMTLENVDLCSAAFQGDCIDSCSFADDKFYIQWQGNKWTSTKKDTRSKVIDIKDLIKK